MSYDLTIRNGNLIDGTGAAARPGDVAIQNGQIVAVGEVSGSARREIDAQGMAVTPGFVDIHTHYDGQATWDPQLAPSCYHGVTTAVMGNCGVGFAPVRPGQQGFLIELMEGVEDIPGTALHEGIDWSWESFPQYLDALQRRRFTMDLGTQVPHGSIRVYVMGERGARNEPATPEDIEQMAELVKLGVAAGALGFSTSRTIAHTAINGEPVPGTFAADDELFGIGRVYGLSDRGVLAPGMRGDLNIIDLDGIQLESPEMVFDLPAGGKRFMQRARGYRATVVAGEVTLENDELTGALPGRLIRGAQSLT